MEVAIACALTASSVFGLVSLAKPQEVKFKSVVFVVLSLGIYFLETFKVPQAIIDEKVTSLFNLVCLLVVLPLIYTFGKGWFEFFVCLSVQVCAGLGIVLCNYALANTLNDLLSVATGVLYAVSLVVLPVLGGIGYSQIPQSFMYPIYSHILARASLESSYSAISASLDSFYYQYTYRGLKVPKSIENKIKVLRQEQEDTALEIQKYNSKSVNTCQAQFVFGASGALFMSLCFVMLSFLAGILVERFLVSDCKWSCGFQAATKSSQLLTQLSEVLTFLPYLFPVLLGLMLTLGSSSLGLFKLELYSNSEEDLLKVSYLVQVCSFSTQAFLYTLYNLEARFPLLQIISQGLFVGTAYLGVLYWFIFKCKDRKKY